MKAADADGKAALDRARRRLAAVGSIAGLVTHQVRNRLATIRAALELLAEGLEADLSAEYRAALLGEVDRVIGDFNLGADMLRGGTAIPAMVSAREMAAEALAAFGPAAVQAGVELVAVPGEAADRVCADRRLLRLVLLNLLRNSIAALHGRPGGRVTLSVGLDRAWVYWDVLDNGPGLPVAVHDRLEREPASGEEPAGLGLALSRDAMLVMGGRMRYLTPRGEPGARFRIGLPLAG